jgi:hypothetical protein
MPPVLKTNLAEYLAKKPCYDPRTRDPSLKMESSGEVQDILDLEAFSAQDRIAAVLKYLDDRCYRLFMVKAARAMLAANDQEPNDKFSFEALDIVEKYLSGKATEKDLSHARDIAFAAIKERSTHVGKAAAMIAAQACFIKMFRERRPVVARGYEQIYLKVMRDLLVAEKLASPRP